MEIFPVLNIVKGIRKGKQISSHAAEFFLLSGHVVDYANSSLDVIQAPT